MHASDGQLVEACLRGDHDAWGTLVDRYTRLVYSIARRSGASDADADEIVQSVFLIVFRRLDSLRDQSRLSSWLISITHRECWRVYRLRQRNSAVSDAYFADVSAPDPDEAARWEQQHLVRTALAELGGQCEALLTGLYLNSGDVSYEALAASLGLATGSIGPKRARCMARLEKILLRMGFQPDAGSEAAMKAAENA